MVFVYDLGMTSKERALQHFKRHDPLLFKATQPYHALIPHELPHKRTRAQLFEELISTIISQQLAVRAADVLATRLKETCGQRIDPAKLLALSDLAFRSIGISGAKAKTMRGVAEAISSGSLDLLKLSRRSEDEIDQEMQKLWGIGSWTAEMFLLFGFGKPDVFSPGDLGLVRAVESLYALSFEKDRERFLEFSMRWAPYRSFASLLLWKYKNAIR